MASKISGVKIAFCLTVHLIALSSAQGECLFKCQEFGSEDEICITGELLCDHFPDCDKGEDEENCGCKGFTCEQGGLCLRSSERCDGFRNCIDSSDELNCTKVDYKERFPSLPDHDLCKTPCGHHGSCSFASNGRTVCRCDYGYTGASCETETEVEDYQTAHAQQLPEETFTCDLLEIPKELFCDGKFDCADKSDETNCTLNDYRKSKPHLDRRFLCLKPCQRTTCAFDNEFHAVCPCPENSEGVFCEKVIQTISRSPETNTAATAPSVNSTSARTTELAEESAEKSGNFFTTIALPVIGVAGLAIALWLWISKPWATGGVMGRPLVAA